MTGVLHADGTVCGHEGTVQGLIGAIRCPAGQPLTHVYIGATPVEIGKAFTAAAQLGGLFIAAMSPLMGVFRELAGPLAGVTGGDPQLRVLFAAVRVADAITADETARLEAS